MMTMMMTIQPLRLQKIHKRRNKSKSMALLLKSLNPVLLLIHNVDVYRTMMLFFSVSVHVYHLFLELILSMIGQLC